MLEMKNITKTFGDFKALDDLTMTVPKGTVYGLVGPNGAGKSTAIRHLTGVYRPDSGEITLDGRPIYENPDAKVRIGYIPDDIFYFPSATLEDMRKYYRGSTPNSTTSFLNGCTKSSGCRRKAPSAGSPRACRSRQHSTWPSAAARRC